MYPPPQKVKFRPVTAKDKIMAYKLKKQQQQSQKIMSTIDVNQPQTVD